MFEIQRSGDKTSSGEIGLDIRTHASPKVGQDQVLQTVMCVLLITQLVWLVGRLGSRTAFNHTSWVVVATPTDRPKSVRNYCVIEGFGEVFVSY